MNHEQIRQVLDALQDAYMHTEDKEDYQTFRTAYDICGAALAEPEGEPIGEIVADDMGKPFNAIQIRTHFYKEVCAIGTKLFTHPASKPLTGDSNEQQVRSKVDAVDRQQPPEGLSSVHAGSSNSLVNNILALLSLDKAGCLVPHGLGGHARTLLTAAAEFISSHPASKPAQLPELTDEEMFAAFNSVRAMRGWAFTDPQRDFARAILAAREKAK